MISRLLCKKKCCLLEMSSSVGLLPFTREAAVESRA